jgi:pimeloyl-ACP methyl ester carboxylesterase
MPADLMLASNATIEHNQRPPMVLRSLACLALLGFVAGTPAAAQQAVVASDLTVVFVGGYGANLATATSDFAALRAALAARSSNSTFVQFSYAGLNGQGCAASPAAYGAVDTAQDIEISKRNLMATLQSLRQSCGATHIVVIGHSLGGLVAFQTLADQPLPGVTDLITIDSPLGGAPADEIQSCIDWGLCADGPVASYLAELRNDWTQTSMDNSAKAARLAAAGVRASAWGNPNDCLYNAAACMPFARVLLAGYDSRETQWLGIPRAIRRDYLPANRLSSLLASHHAVLVSGAAEIATDLLS